MKALSLYHLIFLSLSCFCQKMEGFYDVNWQPAGSSQARYYVLIEKKDTLWNRRNYYIPEKSLQMEGNYIDADCKVNEGMFYYYHPNKVLSSNGFYKNGKRNGIWLSYFKNMRLSDSSTYEAGRLLKRMHWHSNGFISDSVVFEPDSSGVEVRWFDNGVPSSVGIYSAGRNQIGKWQYFHKNGKLSAVEKYDNGRLLMQQYYDEEGNLVKGMIYPNRESDFPGGQTAWLKYLDKKVYFPPDLKISNAGKATIVVSWVINEEGEVEDAEIIAPFHIQFDKIVLAAINKSPKWQPAVEHNRRVKSYKRQPLTFRQE